MIAFETEQTSLDGKNGIAELFHVDGGREVILRAVNHAAIPQHAAGGAVEQVAGGGIAENQQGYTPVSGAS